MADGSPVVVDDAAEEEVLVSAPVVADVAPSEVAPELGLDWSCAAPEADDPLGPPSRVVAALEGAP